MIKVDELIYGFKLRLEKGSRNDNFSIPVEDIVVYLNDAQLSWIKTKLNENNPLRAGFETIRKRVDDLQVLKQDNVKLSVVKGQESMYTHFVSSLDSLNDYMFYLSSYSVAKKSECESFLENNLVRQGDLKTQYFDTNYTPSFEWQETLTTLGDGKLYIYTDGTFSISNVFITYLRYPKKIDKEGYIRLDGSRSTDQDCELPEYAKQDLIDLAVKFAAHATENVLQAQAAEDRLNKNTE